MTFASGSRMQTQWAHLMESSEHLVQETARGGRSEISVAASRLLHDRSEWQVWENEFGAAVRKIVIPARRDEQIRLLRVAGFSWIHNLMPFRHVREHRLRGDRRQRLINGLHSSSGFTRGMVIEYHNYIRSTCSFACSAHIGDSLLGDPIFTESMSRYQEVYSEYFRSYCDAHFSVSGRESGRDRELLPLLKRQVDELRRAILDYPRSATWLQRELQLRAQTGDTQHMLLPDSALMHL